VFFGDLADRESGALEAGVRDGRGRPSPHEL
jgi:hypothetical protein